MKASMTWYEAQTPLGDTSRLKTNPLFRLEPVMWKFDPVNFGTVEIDMAREDDRREANRVAVDKELMKSISGTAILLYPLWVRASYAVLGITTA